MTELFRSDNLLVRRRGSRGGLCVVAFDSYTSVADLDREGFGEGFLAREGFDAIHVVARDNRWYQYPEMRDALAAIRAAVAGQTRVLTYGSSMGGYAALRFAGDVGAHAALALSPQFSVDPRVVPSERRWQADVARIAFDERAFEAVTPSYLFYDSTFAPDVTHAELFADMGVTVIAVPHGGHPVGALLAETGVLKDAVRLAASGHLDHRLLARRVRTARRQSRHYLFLLARRTADRRPQVAIAALRRAAAIEPESHILSDLAVLLERVGEHDEAEDLHQRALARTPHNLRARLRYAEYLERAGDRIAARREVAQVLAEGEGSARFVARVVQFRMAVRGAGLTRVDRWIAQGIARAERSPRYAGLVRGLSKVAG